MLKNPSEYEKGRTMVYLVRHGDRIHIPNTPNAGMIAGGPGLSALGKKQAKRAAKEFSKVKDEVDVVYCSTMNRAIETAEEIARVLKKKPIKLEDLCELDNIWGKRKYHRIKFWKTYIKYNKSIKSFNRILAKHPGKVIVIVAYGGIIKGILKNKLGLSIKKANSFDYHNCHISLLRFKGRKLDYIPYFNSKGIA